MSIITYRKFAELVHPDGESVNIDYKIECNAFNSDKKANAELVKDIIALANNGKKKSYLIIGVSNDGKGFKSVINDKLTDDNLQRLCVDYIFPVPNLQLQRKTFSEISGIEFVIIQIGPNAQQCFRFAKDMVGDGFEFRKSHVWVRHGATSDPASPEEIKRMLEGHPPTDARITVDDNTFYNRKEVNEKGKAVMDDITRYIREIAHGDIVLYDAPLYEGDGRKRFRAVITLNGKLLKINVFVIPRATIKNAIIDLFADDDHIAHATLVVSVGNVSSGAVEASPLKLKESWGWLCTDHGSWGAYRYPRLNYEKGKFPPYICGNRLCLILTCCEDTEHLYHRVTKCLAALQDEPEIRDRINKTYYYINEHTLSWLQDGCPVVTTKCLPNKEKLKKNELYDEKKYGKNVMIKQSDRKLKKELEEFLGLKCS